MWPIILIFTHMDGIINTWNSKTRQTSKIELVQLFSVTIKMMVFTLAFNFSLSTCCIALYCSASSLKKSKKKKCLSTPDTIFWFQAKQFLFLFFKAASLAEKRQIPVFGLTVRGFNSQFISMLAITPSNHQCDFPGLRIEKFLSLRGLLKIFLQSRFNQPSRRDDQNVKRASYCCLTPHQKYFTYILERLHSMKWWWCPLCTRPTCLVGSL